jgi:hypothetical protein
MAVQEERKYAIEAVQSEKEIREESSVCSSIAIAAVVYS